MIVIFGARLDPNVAGVARALVDEGVDHLLVDHIDQTRLTLELCAHHVDLRIDGRSVRPTAAWYRSKIPIDRFGEGAAFREQVVTAQFWRGAVLSMAASLENRVVNSIAATRRAADKLMQLHIAGQNGLATPPSIISNDIEAIAPWFDAHHSVVAKSVIAGSMPASGLINLAVALPTLRVERGALTAKAVSAAPTFLQQEVQRAFEVRVIVFGGRMFAFKQVPSTDPGRHVDWRRYLTSDTVVPCEVPPSVEQGIRRFLRELTLVEAHLDFAVDHDGRWFFLECNSAGIFAMYDELLGGEISRAAAKCLIATSESVALEDA